MYFRLFVVLSAVILIAWIAGCGGDNNPSSSGGSGGTTVKEDPSFSNDILPIFSARGCAGLSCHGEASNAGLRLEANVAYDSLVDVNSTEVPSLKRVAPGDAVNSYIVHKIEGRQSVGDRMPPPPRQALSSEEIQNIKNWINQGAKNN